MFKAVSCWVGHLGCKLDEFDHDISTFRKKEDFMVPKQNSSTLLLPLIFENCMSYQKNDQLFQEEVLTCMFFRKSSETSLFQWILQRRDPLFIVGGGSQFQKRFI